MKLNGISASEGIAIGPAIVIREVSLKEYSKTIELGMENQEIARFEASRQAVKKELDAIREQAAKLGKAQEEVVAAHLMMLDDPTLIDAVGCAIRNLASAEQAVENAISEIAKIFSSMNDAYMQERAADIKDIGRRLMLCLQGVESAYNDDRQGIIVATDLLPSDTALLDPKTVLGFVTQQGGRTSHSAIITRAVGLPAVVGLGSALAEVEEGDLLIIDGSIGEVYVNPKPGVVAQYREKLAALLKHREKLTKLKQIPSITADGTQIELAVNIGTLKDLPGVLEVNADGVGLFRTEFLFMDKSFLPTEEEQFIAYKTVLETLKDKKIIIRTLDAGGDKGLPYLNLPKEENPALGLRATRLCLARKDIFKTQLRALLRAGIYGKLHIMFPMIAGISDLRAAKAVLAEVQEELSVEGIMHKLVPIGIMVEIPSAAVIADLLIQEVDFFSIGTNDLVQYTLAADRMNDQVAYISDYFHPAVIRLISQVAKAATSAEKWVGMCGEMAGDPLATVLLIGFGLTELSMNGPAVLEIKQLVRNIKVKEAEFYAERALRLSTAEEVRKYLSDVVKKYSEGKL